MAKEETEPKVYTKENDIDNIYFGMVEQTLQESSYVQETQDKPFNPDDLYKLKGGLDFYEEMLKDDQCSVVLQLKKDLVLGSGFNIVSEDEDQEDIIDDLYCAIDEEPDIPFEEMLQEILSAYEFGYSVTEKIFKKRDDGGVSLKILKTRHPDSFVFYTDEKGNLEKIEQRGSDRDISLDPRTLIHYVNNRKFGNPYGKSDLRPAYEAWYSKRQMVRYYGIFMEKYASPTPVAKYDSKAKQVSINKMYDIIKRFQTKTAIVAPKEFDLEFLQSNSTGAAYRDAIEMFNMFIGRSMFIPDLLGFQGSDTAGGSFALGKEHMDLFFHHIGRRRRTLEGLVNKHIIKPIVLFNFGEQEIYPKFVLNPIREEDVKDAARIWIEAVKAKIFKPNDEEINHFRKMVDFPEGDIVEPEKAETPRFGKPEDDVNTKKQGEDDQIEDDTEVEVEGKKDNFVFKIPEGTAHKKVNFKTIANQLDNVRERVMMDTMPVVREIYADVIDQIQKKKILDKRSPERIDSIKIKHKKKLELALKENFKNHYKASKKIAQNELIKSEFAEPLTTEEFLRVLEYEDFRFIGDWEFKVKQNIKTELISAIKDGKPLSVVEGILTDEGIRLSEVSLERYARTKGTEIMNHARMEFFEESNIVQGYQYSAIMDGRTTVICAGLHGKKFKLGTEPVPPLHFNCRSLLIPITIFEEFTPDTKVGGTVIAKGDKKVRVPKKSIEKHIEDNIGTGFSKL